MLDNDSGQGTAEQQPPESIWDSTKLDNRKTGTKSFATLAQAPARPQASLAVHVSEAPSPAVIRAQAPAAEVPGPANRLPAPLTAVRFFAALPPLAEHFFPAAGLGLGAVATAAIGRGYLAVTLFHVLSGYAMVMTRPNEMSKEQRRQFWMERFIRLYPGYLIALALVTPFVLYKAHLGILSLQKLTASAILYVAMLHAWAPRLAFAINPASWSVAAMAFFYLLFPFAVRRLVRMSDRRLVLTALGLWCTSLGMAALYWLIRPDGPIPEAKFGESNDFWKLVLHANPLVRCPEFLVGVAGAVYLRRHRDVLSSVAGPVMVLGVLVWAVLLVAPIPYVFLHNGLAVPCAIAVVAGGAQLTGRPARWLSAPWLQRLGAAGYGIFILQFAIFPYWNKVTTIAFGERFLVLRYIGFCVCLIGLAVLCVERMERPMRRRMRTFLEHRGFVAARRGMALVDGPLESVVHPPPRSRDVRCAARELA